MKPAQVVFWLLLTAGVLLAAGFLWGGRTEKTPAAEVSPSSVPQPRNRHEADLPRALPAEALDARCLVMRAWDRAVIPVADRFESPLGGEKGAFVYDAQPFGAKNEDRGGLHAGQDWNGIGGENTDFGDPVYAAGRGMVIYKGRPSDEWGNVVVLAHRLPDGEIVQTLYAHLSRIDVSLRQQVARGQKIGLVGSADGLYWAHLHFEAVKSSFNEAGQPGYFAENAPGGMRGRIDPGILNELVNKDLSCDLPDDIFSLLERQELERNSNGIRFNIAP